MEGLISKVRRLDSNLAVLLASCHAAADVCWQVAEETETNSAFDHNVMTPVNCVLHKLSYNVDFLLGCTLQFNKKPDFGLRGTHGEACMAAVDCQSCCIINLAKSLRLQIVTSTFMYRASAVRM